MKFLKQQWYRGLTCIRNIFQFALPNTNKDLTHFILERFGFWCFFLNFLHSLLPDLFPLLWKLEESRIAWQHDVVLLNSAVYGFQQMFLLQRQCEKKYTCTNSSHPVLHLLSLIFHCLKITRKATLQ